MHSYQGLFWEHWNQSRLWIVGAASFLLLMTLSVWLNHDWIMREFRNDPFELDKFAWVVGFTAVGLMFVNYRVREVNLYFPRRQFALPCRTMPIVLSHLIFKTLAAAGLGLLIALYHRVLLEEPFSFLPVYLFVAMVAAAQALAILAAFAGPWMALGAGAFAGLSAFGLYLVLKNNGPTIDPEAVRWVSGGMFAMGWAASLTLAPLARRGAGFSRGQGRDGATAKARAQSWVPVSIVWEFRSQSWAHAWYEWRRVVCWVPRVGAPASILCVVMLLSGEGEFSLMLFVSLVAIPAVMCSYFLFRLTPAESRFLLARPGAFQALVDGKLLAALSGTSATVALAVVVLEIMAIGVRDHGGDVAINWHTDFWILYPMAAASLWIALTSTPVFVAGMGLWFVFGILVIAPIAGLASLSLPLAWVYGLLAAAVGVVGLRRLQRRGVPVPWELGLVIPVFLPSSLAWWINGDELRFVGEYISFQLQIAFLVPLLLLWAGLIFAWRIGVVTGRRVAGVALTHFLTCVLVAAGLSVEGGTPEVFWWIAACFAPLVWVPLALRMQQYR